MADHNQTPEQDSVNPLFNKMDALMARHRSGPAARLDDIPVLTDVAPKAIPSLFDVVDDIPALTDVVEPNLAAKIADIEIQWQFDHREPDISHLDAEIVNPASQARPSALPIDPLPFQKTAELAQSFKVSEESPITRHTDSQAIYTPQAQTNTLAEFQDLPMLDLEEFNRAPNPEYLELPTLSVSAPRNLEMMAPTEHFIATDLILSLDETMPAEPLTVPDFAQILAETSLAADEVPHLDLDAILALDTIESATAMPLSEPAPEPEPELETASEQSPAYELEIDTTPELAAGKDEPSLSELTAHTEFTAQTIEPFDLEIDLTAAQAADELSTPHLATESLSVEWPHDLPSDDQIYEINLSDETDLRPEAPSPLLQVPDEPLLAIDAISPAPLEPIVPAPTTLIWEDEPELVLLSSSAVEPNIIDLDEVSQEAFDEPATESTEATQPLHEQDESSDTSTPAEGIAAEENSELASSNIPQAISSDTIAEITASVGAQLAIDVATEIEQLTKQHFSALMNQFYGETLRKLTEEISRDLEAHLAPRIAELVEAELRSKKLID